MTELVVDAPRLRKELEYVTAHRDRWLQGAWIQSTPCGTVGCLAGNTVMNAGYQPHFDGDRATTQFVRDDAASPASERHVADVAADLLGLDTLQANQLFAATNSLYELWAIASEFTNGEIEIPPEVRDEAGSFL